MPAVDRLRIETLIFAHDLMEVALSRLYAKGLAFEDGGGRNADRISMFSDAWTIVDQIHVARQVLLSLTDKSHRSDTQAFIDDYSVAWALRNKMDHINENMLNLANKKGTGNALFGQLTFFRPSSDLWEQGLREGVIRGELIMVSAGLMPDNMVMALTDMLDLHLPICSFALEAFGLKLPLERAVFQLRALMQRISENIKGQVTEQVERQAKNPEDKKRILQSNSGHVTLRLDMEMDVQTQIGLEGADRVFVNHAAIQ